MFGQQNPRPVHVAPPLFAPAGANTLLQGFLAQSPGGLMGFGDCVACQYPGMRGLGADDWQTVDKAGWQASVARTNDAPPPSIYGGPISAPSKDDQEVMRRLEAAEELRRRGASDEEAFKGAGLSVDSTGRAVAAGASEGILGGIASIVSGILNPLAQGGATAYGIYQQGRLQKDAEKARQQELLVLQETRRRDQEFAAAQSAQSAAFWSANGGKIAGGAVAAAAAIGLAAWAFGGRGKRGRR